MCISISSSSGSGSGNSTYVRITTTKPTLARALSFSFSFVHTLILEILRADISFEFEYVHTCEYQRQSYSNVTHTVEDSIWTQFGDAGKNGRYIGNVSQ